MKKTLSFLLTLSVLFALSAAPKQKNKTVKIGIAKIVQHPALDSVEKGIIDAIEAA